MCLLCCFSSSFAKPKEFRFELSCSATPDRYFQDLQHALVVTTESSVSNDQIYDPSQLPNKTKKLMEKKFLFIYTPNTEDFVKESVRSFVRSAGISIGHDRFTDYELKVKLKELKVLDGEGSGTCSAVLEWGLYDPERRMILDGTARGRNTLSVGQNQVDVLDKAYSKALKEIDWEGIARQLNTPNKKQNQAQERVTGAGNTTLEHTVIRWYIISTPSGADVSWRVVSSTPDVRNTNSNFVGTTPYESTESFDIKGLTDENAGNVQIEVTCEKAGYLPQRKRFNLRQAIDQKEISSKFNLVKESDE